MIPLCTRHSFLELENWGWAFISFGSPWVAHLVWPIPIPPVIFFLFWSCFSSLLIFPFDLQLAMLDPLYTAIPALSYPRYSSLLSPFKIIGKESLSPKYPTIPHIIILNLFFNFWINKKINIYYNIY